MTVIQLKLPAAQLSGCRRYDRTRWRLPHPHRGTPQRHCRRSTARTVCRAFGSRWAQTRTTNAELTTRFERDVIPLRAPLYRRALRMTHDRADARGSMQDTMMRAFAGFHRFGRHQSQSWLHRILTNMYINSYRKSSASRRCIRPRSSPTSNWRTTPNTRREGLRSAEEEALDALPTSRLKRRCRPCPNNSAWWCTTPTSRISNTRRSPKSWTPQKEP